MSNNYVFFMWDGKQYRTDYNGLVVERLEDGGKWTRVYTGRILRSAKMAVNEWLEKAKGGQ